jgi:hypothetical protein
MKRLLLSVCLAATAAVSAAELKDPREVSREWTKTIEEPLLARSEVTNLKEQCPTRPIFPQQTFQQVPAWEPKKETSPFEGLIRPPDYKPDEKPRRAKPYEFNGETYWLIPLVAQAGA